MTAKLYILKRKFTNNTVLVANLSSTGRWERANWLCFAGALQLHSAAHVHDMHQKSFQRVATWSSDESVRTKL